MTIDALKHALEFIESVKIHQSQISKRDNICEELNKQIKQLLTDEKTVTVGYDLSPTAIKNAIHSKMIELGWTPPKAEQDKPVSGVVIREGMPTLLMGNHIKPTDQRLYTHPQSRTWVGLMRGVRVEGDTVVISVKGGNDAARELCGALIKEKNNG